MSEQGLLEMIRARVPRRQSGVTLGPGDDAALLSLAYAAAQGAGELLVTTDTLVEGTHFSLSYFTPFDVGWKSLAVSLSDIAGTGGTPWAAVVGMGLPKGTRQSFVEEYLDGFIRLTKRTGCALVGGDIVKAPVVAVTVTVLGLASSALKRKGARRGDVLCVTGGLGLSSVGLAVLQEKGGSTGFAKCRERHLRPVPRIKEGRTLAEMKIATAMIDTSDSVAKSILLLAEESRVGFDVDLRRIRLPDEVRRFIGTYAAAKDDVDRKSNFILSTEEDFELMFTCPKRSVPDVMTHLRCQVQPIGQATPRDRGCRFICADGTWLPIVDQGFQHF
jgi:thiamine-monophosphate kinase